MKYQIRNNPAFKYAPNRVRVIRALRGMTGMTLKCAKDITDDLVTRDARVSCSIVVDIPNASQEWLDEIVAAGYLVSRVNANILEGIKQLAIEAINSEEYVLCNRLLAVLHEEATAD